jgi:hypothetical protein
LILELASVSLGGIELGPVEEAVNGARIAEEVEDVTSVYRVVGQAEKKDVLKGVYKDGPIPEAPGYKHVWAEREHAESWLNSGFYSAKERASQSIVKLTVPKNEVVPSHLETFNHEQAYKVPNDKIIGPATEVKH